jgi:hypothetical protein
MRMSPKCLQKPRLKSCTHFSAINACHVSRQSHHLPWSDQPNNIWRVFILLLTYHWTHYSDYYSFMHLIRSRNIDSPCRQWGQQNSGWRLISSSVTCAKGNGVAHPNTSSKSIALISHNIQPTFKMKMSLPSPWYAEIWGKQRNNRKTLIFRDERRRQKNTDLPFWWQKHLSSYRIFRRAGIAQSV